MCQLFGAHVSQGLCPYAVKVVVCLIIRSPTTMLKNKTPFEAGTGKYPDIKHIHTFDAVGYVHIPLETRKNELKNPAHASHSTTYHDREFTNSGT